MPNTIDINLSLDTARVTTSASAYIDVPPVQRFTQNMVPARYVTFTVEPYYVFRGLPVAESSLGEVVTVETGVTSWGNPAAPSREELDLGATSRWIPLEGTYNNLVWQATQGGSRINLYTEADSNPVLRGQDFQYLRGELFTTTTAMNFQNGAFLYTRDVNLSATGSVSFVMVLVPRVPYGEEYVLLQTGPTSEEVQNNVVASAGEYFSLGYDTLGNVALTIGNDRVRSTQTISGGVRPSKPLIVGVNLNLQEKVLRVAVVDSRMQVVTHQIEHPFAAQFWVGKSALGVSADAVMNVLDIAYWDSALDEAQFENAVQKLNQLYGVTAARLNIQTAGDLT